MTFRSGAATAVAALTLALGTTGCGGGDEPQSVGATQATTSTTATTAPAGAPSSKPAKMVARLDTANFLPAMKSAMADKKSLRTTMKMVAAGKTMTVSGVQNMSTPPAMAINLNGETFGGKGRIVVVDNIIYVSMKGLAPEGKYRKVDPKDTSDPLAAQMGSMLQSMDPTKTFNAFDHGLKKVVYVKTETIGGERLDRYKVTIDMASALKAQKKPIPPGVPKTIDYDVWMDKDHLIRRVTFELPGVSTVMDASGWGEPVVIKAPAAADIVRR
jgi:hypothetical protein